MDDRTQQARRKRFSSHSLLHFYRNRVMNVLVVVIGILYFIFRLNYVIPKEMQRCYDLLLQNMQEAFKYQEYADDADTLYVSVQDQDYLSASHLFIAYINNGYDTQSCVDKLNSITDSYQSAFYLQSDGTLISSSNREPLSLTEDEMAQLLSEGFLQHNRDSVRYWALPDGDNAMIVRADETYAQHISMDVLRLLCLDGFIYDNETLDVIEADESLIPGNVGSMYIGEPMDMEDTADSQIQIRMISPYKDGLGKYTNMKLAAIQPLEYQNTRYSICAYIPVTEIASNILVKSGLPTILCLGFICLSIFGSLHLRQIVLNGKGDETQVKKEKNRKIIRLPFNCLIDVDLTRYIVFMQFFMGLLVMLCSVLLLALNRFSITYEDTEYNLQQLVETEKIYQKTLNECWSAYSSPAVGMAQTVNKFYLNSGDVATDEGVQDNLQNMVDSTFINEISIYDENGQNIYTTANSVGYPLSTDPSSSQFSFWDLLSGDKQYVITRSDNNSGVIYCAMKRTDAVGIVVLSFSDQGFSDLEKKLSTESVMKNFYYRDSCLFVDNGLGSDDSSNDGTAYRYSSDGDKVNCIVANLPVLSYGDTFCGFRTYDSQQCLMVGHGGSDRSIFFFEPVSEIIDGLGGTVATYAVFLLIICSLGFLGCAVYTEENINPVHGSDPEEPCSHHIADRMIKHMSLSDEIEDSQKSIWRRCLYSTIILIVITLLLDALLNSNSMLSFMLNARWEKGFNLFAMIEVILIILAACVLFSFLRFLFKGLTKNFPQRYTTVIQMVFSILDIVIVVVIAICCANELGIDTATILASVGISGLALGIAAKDTINDLLSGLFIILDGRIHVGDWVQIGDFYGQIDKINIRTTKVKFKNKEKSINNSDMNNLINLSNGSSAFSIGFNVAYDTDLESLKKLITNSFDRFQSACGGELLDNVIFSASDFDGSTITVGIVFCCEEKNRNSFKKKCIPVLIGLLKENGITVGASGGNLVVELAENSKINVHEDNND